MPVALLLSFAIVTEVAGTFALRYSDGFTKLMPSAFVVLGYGISFWLLALVLRDCRWARRTRCGRPPGRR